ncbi:hypothetical protein A675_03751 [Salmonella enterica subsp. enterica serovar Enteritidis str. 2009K1726]|nr:hypothetical protein A675_03751 [Salmonella enterica subsp. enterica serovar Enteritidis str. 2009K1726]EPI93879.1 hypothetical protein A678_04499 [Salmonella enterica subsp. enterica serovar Enteritidis str. 2010K-0271]EPJ08534.1 hypothetical protein A680_04346 [Salmonella enterica subsp. enterica serovar Enteritidis str. 2010K-0286]
MYTKYLLSGLPRSDSSITRSCLALIAIFFTSVNETQLQKPKAITNLCFCRLELSGFVNHTQA